MNMAVIKMGICQVASRSGLLVKKYAPQILVGSGIVGFVATVVVACKATTKAEEVLSEREEKMQKVESVHEEHNPDYSEEDYKKDITMVKTQTIVKLVKLYAPAATLGVVSIVCILSGHHILAQRSAAIAAAYKAVETGFRNYRGRVVEEFGKEVDQKLLHGATLAETKAEKSAEESKELAKTDGKKSKKKTEPSKYARFFDEYSTAWQDSPEMNLYFLKKQQEWANDKLRWQKHLFLNEVYDMLGMEHTKAGAVVGWVLDKDNDNYVDFGLYNMDDEQMRKFIAGKEASVLLDFNVDGVIWDLI